MRQSGQISAKALKRALEMVKPGVNLLDIEKAVDEQFKSLGAAASFKTVSGYNFATCLTVNDEIVHGLPRDYSLKDGDILGVDLGAVFKGWHTDVAWSVVVGKGDEEKKRFLKTGERALENAIKEARAGNRIGDISSAIQEAIEKVGFTAVWSLTGHGVGRSGHEDPEVPCRGKRGTGLTLKAGMILAIEAIYTKGGGELYEKEDGWTIATVDGSWAGLFEMSVLIKEGEPEVLTDWRKA